MDTAAKLAKWEEQEEALNLSLLKISLEGFDPETLLLDGIVERGQKQVTIGGDVYSEIKLMNHGYRFEQFSVPLDATLGETARLIDIVLQANGDFRESYLERVESHHQDPVLGMLYFDVFIGS